LTVIFQVLHAFDNVERMLSELPEIDVVCVNVRPVAQHQVLMTALHAGKHVYCEQPLGATTAQAQEMFELARSTEQSMRDRCWVKVDYRGLSEPSH
jgi:predicted dehydrogenase